jgi:catechol 2,3-dioxygenase-like lactoylglutathione lyase family enzyme
MVKAADEQEARMATKHATHITGVRTVAIPVTDQDRAVEFYVDTLGFEKRVDFPMGENQRWIEVAPPGAASTTALVPASDDRPAGVDTGIRLSTTDTDADHATLRARGVDADDILRWEGVPPMFVFRDQDGNSLVIVEQR